MKLGTTIYWVWAIRHLRHTEYKVRIGYVVNFDSETIIAMTKDDKVNCYVPCIRTVDNVSLEYPDVGLWKNGVPRRFEKIVCHC